MLPPDVAARLRQFLDKLTPEARAEWLRFRERRETHAPGIGEPAPDFDLPKLGGSGRVALSSFRGRKPVALIFGSYT